MSEVDEKKLSKRVRITAVIFMISTLIQLAYLAYCHLARNEERKEAIQVIDQLEKENNDFKTKIDSLTKVISESEFDN